MKKLVVLSGAGISAESGIKTFRDADGLWEGHDVMQVASPEGFFQNPELVLDFYNQRRAQLNEVSPNKGHLALVKLESKFDVHVITQNVDDLHERAGSSQVMHLHGQLRKVRSIADPDHILDWVKDLNLGDQDIDGNQLRPHIVWFGEAVPMLTDASICISNADIVIIVGTSLQVYPAAGLIAYAPAGIPVYYVDPKPASSFELSQRAHVEVIKEVGSIGLEQLASKLLGEY